MFCGVAASEPMQSELQVLDAGVTNFRAVSSGNQSAGLITQAGPGSAETLQVHVKLRQMYCFLENFEDSCHRSVGLAWNFSQQQTIRQATQVKTHLPVAMWPAHSESCVSRPVSISTSTRYSNAVRYHRL